MVLFYSFIVYNLLSDAIILLTFGGTTGCYPNKLVPIHDEHKEMSLLHKWSDRLESYYAKD